MEALNGALRFVNSSIDKVVEFVKENMVVIACGLVVVYLLQNQAKRSEALGHGYRLADASEPKRPPKGDTSNSRDEELRRVRLKQQEIANQKAKEAAEKRKAKEAEERKRKNEAARHKKELGGHRLGSSNSTATTTTTSSSSSGGYNPMQPWSSTSRGYRPARRTVRRS